MSWYNGDGDAWHEIVKTVAAEEHRTTQMVEKDTVQSLILLGLSMSEVPFVFKGGTSLSKVYNLIDRFSEDIDLSLERRPTESERRVSNAAILEIGNELGLELTNREAVQSRHSYNKYVFEYESLFSETPLEIIVETNFYQPVYPTKMRKVGSFVGKFCTNKSIPLPVNYAAATFDMQVQSLERTFVDKVFAICDYRIQNMQDRDSRHLYDIAKLLPYIDVGKSLYDLIDNVRLDRMCSNNNPSAQPEHNIPEMLREIIESRFYEKDYNEITRKLLYDNVSYEEAVANGIAKIACTDMFDYRI